MTTPVYYYNYDKLNQMHRLSVIGNAYARSSEAPTPKIFYSLDDYSNLKCSKQVDKVKINPLDSLSLQQGLKG